MKKMLMLLWVLFISACTSAPEGIKPVSQFDLNRYLGTWHEIARLDHSFERDMIKVTAEYNLRQDGGVQVINRGFDTKEQVWQKAEGKAYFVKDDKTGHLKVSFFGPFYGAYVVYELDPNYQYAFVSGPNRDYLWLLARTPQLDEAIKQRFLKQANSLGFETETLIWLDSAPPN
ncbi:lipocalin family protein [Catenovulum sp. SM1970]|uniref:lipocalin family protein n=1 Tax=Marinifaba aquimaris TaxID=2741323 RepID=UPI001574930B|nr:lipocalin family protein [Marinifaba aquimaris]NTS78822.1 lipocalin family protein [Marinifaba aquimaris]